ncbi:hypothetical protein Avbf_17100 [Armadillidium vulgare]|nr:hypothetical protein Avbf_17100 [Armadillidium vulgare]
MKIYAAPKLIHNINKNHKIRLLSKPNTVNKTYQLQSTPTRNFNLPLATEKEEQRNRRRRRKGFVNIRLRILLLKDTFNQFKLMRQHRDPRLKPRTET